MSLRLTALSNQCRYAKCRDLFIIMLNVIMLIVVMLNVIMLSVIMLNVLAPETYPQLKPNNHFHII
jgi:hypothetical protein